MIEDIEDTHFHVPVEDEDEIICEPQNTTTTDEHYSGKWLDLKKHMPHPPRFYWVSDGNDVALADWNIEKMTWRYRYMHSCFTPKYMLPVKLPKPPEENK